MLAVSKAMQRKVQTIHKRTVPLHLDAFDQSRVDIIDQVGLRSPRQVTRLPPQ